MMKRISNKAALLIMLAVGLAAVAATALVGIYLGRRDAQRTMDRTVYYLERQCVTYREIIVADEVKSLVRLTEQAAELATSGVLLPGIWTDEYLEDYAQRQRMTDVLVLDGELKPEFACGEGEWRDLYTGSAIAAIRQYPEKIFSQRLTRNGKFYDIAAVARQDAPGVVFCARQRRAGELAAYQSSVESLLAGYETVLSSRVYAYITDGETVIGSSNETQHGKPVSQVALIRALDEAGGGSTMTRINTNEAFLGVRGLYRDYRLYVFMAESYVFARSRNAVIAVFGVYAAAVVVMLLLLMGADQERKRREKIYQRQLEAEVQRATAADQAKTDFLRSMSHDIRTPINIIMGMLEIIGRSPDDRERVQDCREKAQTAARYLLALVNDVLTLNRLSRKETASVTMPYRLSTELDEVMLLARAQAEERGVTLAEPEMALEYDELQGNPLYLRQIGQNIIGNAIKYSFPGGEVRCRFRTAYDADGICRLTFICEDDGVGMSEEFQKHMFEAFAQENPVRDDTAGGVGLGLAVVKRIVDEHGGTIRVDSAPGEGTRFEISMPVTPCAIPEPAAIPAALPSLTGCRILVAEDNDLNRQIAVYLLEDAGVQVVQARDGREAVETFAASKPGELDAVLMDVMMPVMDGLDATRAIRAMERPDAALPIIAMTANLFDEDVAACLEAGMDGHIPKPLDAAQMLRTIVECIRRKRHDA